MTGVIALSRVKKAGLALLSKRITLGEDGRPLSDGSPCAMTRGTATRVSLNAGEPATALTNLIIDLGSHEALVLGDHVATDDTIEITKAAHADPANGLYGRSLETFRFKESEPAVLLLDYDQKAISDSARAAIEAAGGFEGAITSLIPSYPTLARVTRASTSAGLRNGETGETFPGNGGQHVYLFARDGADIKRFLQDLQKRAWLAGMGWIMVSARGCLLVRSIIDITVGSAERLVFEGQPRVVPPLVQDQEARRPIAIEGELLDTAAACPPLTPEEERQYDELVAAAKGEKQPEVEIAKEAAATALVVRTGVTIEKARAVIAASTQRELGSWDLLHFDNEIGEVSVADVLADPARFHGETLADPLEGRSYGLGKARLYWNRNNSVAVNSFAHGGCVYTLSHDPDYVEQKVEEAGDRAPFVLAELMCHGENFDPVVRERLRNLAAKLGGVGRRAVAENIKETTQRAKRAAAAAARARGEGRKSDGARVSREELILIAGERPAALRAIETRLRLPGNVGPGAVVARGQAPAVFRYAIDPIRLRAGRQEIELPSGSVYLATAKAEHLQAQLDGIFDFSKLNKKGEQYSIDCPADLARHVLANANLLPVHAISRIPVLRADGSVLNQPGYDPATAIFYAPEEEFPPVPDRPTQDDARVALVRLRKPFRAFPFVADADRDAVVGEVLTLVTRHLVARAPAFVHNAVEAGSGKTKLKKVLTTLTVAATPFVAFDNVVRGGRITSPGLSNYLTATIYGDRLLGSNTEVKAATCTVIGLTGNGVEISGDNVRRMFRIDLDAGVERPETREFDSDCEAEAQQDRAELVVAALTILRAHALAGWPGVPGRADLGSFEDWDRLVAGAVVFAGGADIVALLEKTRTADPERDSLAEVLRMLQGVGAARPMKAGEIIRAVIAARNVQPGQNAQAALNGQPIDFNQSWDEWHELLCRMGKDGKPSERSLGRYLTKNAGRIVGGLQLLSMFDSDAKVHRYHVRSLPYGVTGLNGDFASPFLSKKFENETTEGRRETSFEKESESDRLSETPYNPRNPVNGSSPHSDGVAEIGTCAYCRQAIKDGSAFSATSCGAYLH